MEELAKEVEKRTALLKSLGIQKCHVVRQVGSLILIKERNQGTVGAERHTEITSWRLECPKNSIVFLKEFVLFQGVANEKSFHDLLFMYPLGGYLVMSAGYPR